MRSFTFGALPTNRAIAVPAVLGALIATAGAVCPAPAAAASRAHAPAVPGPLRTAPTTDCAGGTVLGITDVTLNAFVSDPDGGALNTDFEVRTGDPRGPVVAALENVSSTSGTEARFLLRYDALTAAAAGRITEFFWRARSDDTQHTSAWSAACRFTFDPTRPGTPAVTPPAVVPVGTPVQVPVGPGSGGDVLPSRYQYSLNSGASREVTADASGHAVLTVTPTSTWNTLTVTGLSLGGNPGESTTVSFGAVAPQPPAVNEDDLDGDNKADLLAVGGRDGLGSGLWLAPGTGDGHVGTVPTDIGANGDGSAGTAGPASFDGAVVLTGRFADSNVRDFLVYHPGDGSGRIIAGDGTANPLVPDEGNSVPLSAGFLRDAHGNDPVQLVNGGHLTGRPGFPDLLGISGDPADGYRLTLYPAQSDLGSYAAPVPLTALTPDGTSDWNEWTIASVQMATSGGTAPALYLWHRSTGRLVLWAGLNADPDSGESLYEQYEVATGWNTGADLALKAADIDGDGTPDVWTVGPDRTVAAYLVTGLSASGPASVTRVVTALG